MGLLQELENKYKLAPNYEKLIYINVIVFAVIVIAKALFFSFTSKNLEIFEAYFALPEDLEKLIFKPWTIVTYSFLHGGFKHLLFNMIALYYSGRIFLVFLSSKQFRNFYILGGLLGGLTFLLSYNLLPAFKNDHSILVGASAAIFSILVGAATIAPNYVVKFFGLFDVKLWVIAVLTIISFISLIPGFNSGGEFAHLGGALLGYLYASNIKNSGTFDFKISKFFDKFFGLFNFKRGKLKTVHKKKKKHFAGHTKEEFGEFNNQKQIDVILDKIAKSGYDSLTKEEKEFLFRSGK